MLRTITNRQRGLWAFAVSVAILGLIVGCNSGRRNSRTGTGTTPPAAPSTATIMAANVALAPVQSTAQIGGNSVVGLVFQLTGDPNSSVDLQSILVGSSGSLDESLHLGALSLVRDTNADGFFDAGDSVIGAVTSSAFQNDDGFVQVNVTTQTTIAANTTAQFLVAVDTLAADRGALGIVGDTVQLFIQARADIALVGTNTGNAVITGAFPLQGPPVRLFLHDHLLITEVGVDPQTAEFVEIYNPTADAIDLSNYYLTDTADQAAVQFHYNLPTGANFGPSNPSDYFVRFPNGTMIGSGQAYVIAMQGQGFFTTYNSTLADFVIRLPQSTEPVMLVPAGAGSAASAGITNSGEQVYLIYWDGASDLIVDVDMVNIGTTPTPANPAISKTNQMVDGPDVDIIPTVFANETAVVQQNMQRAPDFVLGMEGIQRMSFTEAGETTSGGNGMGGDDETSEPFITNFVIGAPTPFAP
jgi:Lamin Tail Domain